MSDIKKIFKVKTFKLSRIEIFYDDYITGIALTYLINSQNYYRLKYFGSDKPGRVDVLELGEDEYITYLSTHSNEIGAFELEFKTNKYSNFKCKTWISKRKSDMND